MPAYIPLCGITHRERQVVNFDKLLEIRLSYSVLWNITARGFFLLLKVLAISTMPMLGTIIESNNAVHPLEIQAGI